MKLTNLKKYNINPSKKLGQNFLIDKNALDKIIQAADLSKDDTVLEVGPGLGVLTLELAKYVKKVIAVEKDRKMVEILKNVLIDKDIKNVEVVEGDILKVDIVNILRHPELDSGSQKMPKRKAPAFLLRRGVRHDKNSYKLVANIPYYLTSPLIRKFLEAENQPKLIVLLLQKEVAQRICAKPPRMSLLAVSVQFYAEPKIISYVSKKSFWPQPKVDSAIIRISPIKREFYRELSPIKIPRGSALALSEAEGYGSAWFCDKFFELVRAGFAHPRKQLINNLSAGLNLSREKTEEIILKAGLKSTQRPSELSVDNWVNLAWIVWGK